MNSERKNTLSCSICQNGFHDFDTVVLVDSVPYHDTCVTLYPTGYIAFHDGQPIGETDNDDGQVAMDIFHR